ncbi:recombinase family protein [Butyricicoccus sp. Marseille-Q5471]|uniref:recombinase family protein n=1 Tax=Butyricicoccus sp. Marseille-Q5471 TaxID=3039493 RepID=UPI0024BCC51E|nr:recombinase family protein [Butyricicoccus sp. Marseille-Q5471]
MPYCAYIRKSRADMEAETHGEGETFARHEKILLNLAKQKKISLTAIYREMVSGETISARPVMQQLLDEVDAGMWDGVLVVEVERLARGDTSDQGRVQKSFMYSNTLIITPLKTYDPANEFDQEYFEFGLFMSRREYKTINRRLQTGRVSSIREGKYPGNVCPYGYDREKLKTEKGWILVPNPQQSEIVRLMFSWFTDPNNHLSSSAIAHKLNDMQVPTSKGGEWTVSTVSRILKNPVYAGYIIWGRRACVKQIKGGEIVKSRPWAENYEMCKGLHEPLVSQEVFDLAQRSFAEMPTRPIPGKRPFCNPLSGLVVCGCCGRVMQRRPHTNGYPDSLLCPQPGCKTVSSPLAYIENLVLESLEKWLEDYKIDLTLLPVNHIDQELKVLKNNLTALQSDFALLDTQQNRLYTLLEQGVYTTAIFIERQQIISTQREELQKKISVASQQLADFEHQQSSKTELVPRIRHVLDVYKLTESAKQRNELLSSVLEKVEYHKSTNLRHSSDSDLRLVLFPKFTSSRPNV